jgi:hypothetical protein
MMAAQVNIPCSREYSMEYSKGIFHGIFPELNSELKGIFHPTRRGENLPCINPWAKMGPNGMECNCPKGGVYDP